MTVNGLEIRIAALHRTGHHAIIEWILDGIAGKRVFLNNVQPDKPVFNYQWIKKRPDYRLVCRDFADYDLMRDVAGDFQKKNALVYNFENKPLAVVFPDDLDETRVRQVGASARIVNVLVCRDPLNNAASYFKKNADKYSDEDFAAWMQLWCDYAEASLARTTPNGHQLLVIHYGFWVHDAMYRKNISVELGISNSEPPDKTMKWGRGSSFAQGSEATGVARSSELLQRWIAFRDNVRFRHMFRDARVSRVSQEYLSAIEDHEGLVNFSQFQSS